MAQLGLLVLLLSVCTPWLVQGAPSTHELESRQASASTWWLSQVQRQGTVAYTTDSPIPPSDGYRVFRNVHDFGATGDGNTDDFEAITRAMIDGNRCLDNCNSSTVLPALVYFPPGTYRISKPIVMPYYTQMVGDAVQVPTIKGLPTFEGIALIDSNPYYPGQQNPDGSGINWYRNQNNFFRQLRNFNIDLTDMPEVNPDGVSGPAGLHWQVAQATSLQNLVFNMKPKSGTNKQQGIYMENGSGGMMSDLTFNGGAIGMAVSNQQFTTRNLTFVGCQTAIQLGWDWLWTFKSISVTGADVALDMSALQNGVNQTVGSVLLVDSFIRNSVAGIKTSRNATSVPDTAGTLLVQNVDFSGTTSAIVGVNGDTILPGGASIGMWIQGDAYIATEEGSPAVAANGANPAAKRAPQANAPMDGCDESTSNYFPIPGSVTESPTAALGASNAVAAALATSTTWTTVVVTLFTDAGGSVVGTATGSDSVPSSSASPTAVTMSSETSTSSTTTISSASSEASGGNSVGVSTASQSSASVNSTGQRVPGSCQSPAAAAQPTTLAQVWNKPSFSSSLLNANGALFERAKPQYQDVPASSFISVKSQGARGDGVTDDSDAIQNVLNSATKGQIVYFDHGAYLIKKTINVPKDIRIVGEIWPLIMVDGPSFSDVNSPQPVFRVGQPGDAGSVEITDLMFETRGPAPGAIIMEWNVQDPTGQQGVNGMWDVHFRVGGSAGTQLQTDQCRGSTPDSKTFNPNCYGAFLMMHITQEATAYFENCWFWVADHELDKPGEDKLNIYNGRGVLIESQGPVWLYGTSSEHNVLYNYQVSNARDIFMGFIQTETAYMQSLPDALGSGFTPNPSYSDPDFSDCTNGACKKTWGLRVLDSSNVYMLGGGLYSFFEDYDQTCLGPESCQENMIDIQCSNEVYLFGLTTKASVNMVNVNGQPAAIGADHRNGFGQTLAMFHQA
jgi:glucan 1,3-beta-glucosidase